MTVSDTHPNTRGFAREPIPEPPEPSKSRTNTSRYTKAGRAARRRPWIALGLSIVTLFMASWIVVPGPNRTMVPLSVGAPEISVWLILMAIVAIIGGVRTWSTGIVARIVIFASVTALLLSLWPMVRFPAVASRANNALTTTLGVDYLDSVPLQRQLRLRASPLIFADLFRGLPRDSVKETDNILFATVAKIPLHAIVYQPLAAGKYPIIVQIYGGAWQRGAPDDFTEFGRYFAARGYVVFAIDYRHAPQFHFPAPIADVRTALTWIRHNAGKYSADTSRIALLGRSAGAHLALMAAYDSTFPPVKAVVGFYSPVDLVDAYRHPPSPDVLHLRDVEEKFIGRPLEEAMDAYQAASPINLVNHPLPPTLLFNGSRDNIVEARYGRQLDEKLRANGTKSVYVEIPWADHAFDEVSNGLSGQLSRYVTERFLAWALTRPNQ